MATVPLKTTIELKPYFDRDNQNLKTDINCYFLKLLDDNSEEYACDFQDLIVTD